MQSIVVIDFGSGNLHSVRKAIEHVANGASVTVSNRPEEVVAADRVIFPGQGAIGSCLQAIDATGMRQAIGEVITSKPLLGICLGLQALYEHSEEDGGIDCLGVLAGRVKRFPAPGDGALKIPHMGWNQVDQNPHPLWSGIEQGARFYFVHSYYVDSSELAEVVGVTQYGVSFTSAASRGNLFAVQFHPEKSQHSGLKLLENFVGWDGADG
ncbi:MAG TPA: imidazole glycerol phosphate synthase subunit HisH [Acidiferrobacteraceae bacterium]|nr:imidazole glycerol phosphate synthase subunit HisH [Acidiferrobacteraceae bacterium]